MQKTSVEQPLSCRVHPVTVLKARTLISMSRIHIYHYIVYNI